METAPTSIEVLLRPTLGQSDEPSDFTWFSEHHECIQHLGVSGGHPSNYELGATLFNFTDRANTDELTPYSVSSKFCLDFMLYYLQLHLKLRYPIYEVCYLSWH